MTLNRVKPIFRRSDFFACPGLPLLLSLLYFLQFLLFSFLQNMVSSFPRFLRLVFSLGGPLDMGQSHIFLRAGGLKGLWERICGRVGSGALAVNRRSAPKNRKRGN